VSAATRGSRHEQRVCVAAGHEAATVESLTAVAAVTARGIVRIHDVSNGQADEM
jgi:hypothetical protein